MHVVLYRARGTNGFIYDMSFNPEIDYVILKRTRKIEKMEIIAHDIEIETAINILKKLYGPKIFSRNIVVSQSYIFENILKRYKVKRIREDFKYNGDIPSNEDVSTVENVIVGKVMSIRKIICLLSKIGFDEKKCMDIIQLLYCERRIKISSFLKSDDADVCSLCNKNTCGKCCFGFENSDVLIYAADNYNIKEPKMVLNSSVSKNAVILDTQKKLNLFLKTKKQFAVLFCTPGSFNFSVLSDSACNTIKRGGRILYITSTMRLMEAKEAFASNIEDANVGITDGFNPPYRDLDITICSYDNYACFHKAFDLVILDYTYAFADNPIRGMLAVSQRAVKERGKFIFITTLKEKWKSTILKGQIEVIPLPEAESGMPIAEPRIIVSRFLNDTEPFIPPMVVDIINWSLKCGIKVIIFVPDEAGVKKVYYYLTQAERMNSENIDTEIEENKNSFIRFRRGEVNVYISMNVKDAMIPISDANVIVMYSDNKLFNAETLVRFASLAEGHSKKMLKSREVVFVGFEESEAMSLAKTSIRAINKAGWDMGYFKE